MFLRYTPILIMLVITGIALLKLAGSYSSVAQYERQTESASVTNTITSKYASAPQKADFHSSPHQGVTLTEEALFKASGYTGKTGYAKSCSSSYRSPLTEGQS